jgi:hypothetical protein
MRLGRRKSRRARAADALRGVAPGRRGRRPARALDSVRGRVAHSGPAKTAQGARQAGRAAGRTGKAVAVYGGRKAAGKRAPLLISVPALAGASIATFLAVRKLRRGAKETVPE